MAEQGKKTTARRTTRRKTASKTPSKRTSPKKEDNVLKAITEETAQKVEQVTVKGEKKEASENVSFNIEDLSVKTFLDSTAKQSYELVKDASSFSKDSAKSINTKAEGLLAQTEDASGRMITEMKDLSNATIEGV